MAENQSSTDQKTVDQTTEAPTVEEYIAPEVSAAMAGERVEFGKDLTSSD